MSQCVSASGCGPQYELAIDEFCLAKFRLDMQELDQRHWCSWEDTVEWVACTHTHELTCYRRKDPKSFWFYDTGEAVLPAKSSSLEKTCWFFARSTVYMDPPFWSLSNSRLDIRWARKNRESVNNVEALETNAAPCHYSSVVRWNLNHVELSSILWCCPKGSNARSDLSPCGISISSPLWASYLIQV